jgi:hypothetical protein
VQLYIIWTVTSGSICQARVQTIYERDATTACSGGRHALFERSRAGRRQMRFGRAYVTACEGSKWQSKK